MSDVRVASRYAKSLIELADEKGILEKVNNDMLLFIGLCKSNRDFAMAIKNPIIQNEKKLAILKKIFQGKVSELTMKFFEIISRKNRETILPTVAEEFHRQYNAYKGIVKATVVTAFPLDSELRARFTKLVKEVFDKEVELVVKVDESMIGGYILTVGDKQIDESINSKLKALKLEFNSAHSSFVKEF